MAQLHFLSSRNVAHMHCTLSEDRHQMLYYLNISLDLQSEAGERTHRPQQRQAKSTVKKS